MGEFIKDLFTKPESEIRIKVRPLGVVSDFVVEDLPILLESARVGDESALDKAINVSEKLIASLDPNFVNNLSEGEQAIARVDVLFIEAGILHENRMLRREAGYARKPYEGKKPGKETVNLVSSLSDLTGRPPVITYEDLILLNPINDRRTFARGHLGRAERDFYEVHRRIEGFLDPTVDLLSTSLIRLAEEGQKAVQEVLPLLDSAADNFKPIKLYLYNVGFDMERDLFKIFRRYYDPHPERRRSGRKKYKGASGQFTAGLPLLDMLLGGNNVPERVHKYWKNQDIYFPRDKRKSMKKSRVLSENGISLASLYVSLGQPESLRSRIQDLDEVIREFRELHFRAVGYQLPGAIRGAVKGTSGEPNVPGFLQERIDIKHIK